MKKSVDDCIKLYLDANLLNLIVLSKIFCAKFHIFFDFLGLDAH